PTPEEHSADAVDEPAGDGPGCENLFGRDEVARVLALEFSLGGPHDADIAIAALAATDSTALLEVRTGGLGRFRFAHLWRMSVPRKPSTTPERGGSSAQRALNTALELVGAEPVADAGLCREVLLNLRIDLDSSSNSRQVYVYV